MTPAFSSLSREYWTVRTVRLNAFAMVALEHQQESLNASRKPSRTPTTAASVGISFPSRINAGMDLGIGVKG